MGINDILYMMLNHVFMGIRWGLIFLAFFGGLVYLVKTFFPNILKDLRN